MKLDKLWIHEYKNLRDFSIDFDEESFTTVLVGKNGTGKSNLLEALVIIFRDLDLGAVSKFKYVLDYEKQGRKVHIEVDPDAAAGKRVIVMVDGERQTYRAGKRGERDYLPTHVFGYYSGISDRMRSLFDQHQNLFYEDLISTKKKRPRKNTEEGSRIRPLFYARLVHSNFVLLAFYHEDEDAFNDILRRDLRIEKLDYALFVLREPPWNSKEGDPRFWRAKGEVSDFLSQVYERARAPLRTEHKTEIGFREKREFEYLFLFLDNEDRVRELAGQFESPQAFFRALESTYISELLSEVRIRVQVRNTDEAISYRDLSEGEQQLLMVLGLLRFTRADDALFLLDEPDTHLNPSWSIEYLRYLRKALGPEGRTKSHVIIATHNPIVIAGLQRTQVQIMQRDQHGAISAAMPEEDPRGMGVGALLTSDVYGLRSDLDIETLEKLDRKRRLAIKEELTEEERRDLTRINEELQHLTFATNAQDPLYRPFVEAMTRLEVTEELQKSTLTNEQHEARKAAIRNILAELKSEREDGP